MTERPNTQLILNLENYNEPQDVIDVLFLEAFASGAYRRAASKSLSRVRPRASMLPTGTRPLRLATSGGHRSVLARGDGWMLRARRWQDGSGSISVLARSNALAEKILADASRGVSEPVSIDPHQVPIGFWHFGSRGPSRSERAVAVAPWSEIRRNYTAPVAAAGDRLMAQQPTQLNGRLVLLHGPPGTGKTTMLRALAVGWRRWCTVDCVLDAEHLFADPGYLLTVALGDEDDSSDASTKERWRLLVLEDCDELIRPGAKSAMGQGLSRLLNVTDGILGQGRRLLVAITTNEPLTKLHPAVTRPGRCLAQIEVGRLTPTEARRWLGRETGVGPGGATLAELCAMDSGTEPLESVAANPAVGQYL